MILEASPEQAEDGSDADDLTRPSSGVARLFVWSYKKGALICASPPAVVSNLSAPDITESIGRLRAVKDPP